VTVDGKRANRNYKKKQNSMNELSFISNNSSDSSPPVQSNSSFYSNDSSDSSRASPTCSIVSTSSFETNLSPNYIHENNQNNYFPMMHKQRLGDFYYNYFRTVAHRSLNVYFNIFDVRTPENEAMIDYYSHRIAEENLLKLQL